MSTDPQPRSGNVSPENAATNDRPPHAPIPETYNGTSMWTCRICGKSCKNAELLYAEACPR